MKDKKRRWKSLALKIEHLRLELEEREDAIKDIERSFMEELSKIETEDVQKENSVNDHHQVVMIDDQENDNREENFEEIKTESTEEKPEEIKKIWKSIAALTHPDKTKDDPEKTLLYKKALDAYNNGSYDEIYRIAAQLGISIPEEATENSINSLESISKNLEEKIKSTEGSVLWLWGKTNPAKRQGIIDLYLHAKGKKRKKKSNA